MSVSTEGEGHVQRVRRYYDDNTAAFERLGQAGTSVHRVVWGPGVRTEQEAVHRVDEMVLDAIPVDVDRPTVVDLGCGLGASLLYLAQRIDMRGEGITISPRQAERAAELIAAAEVGDRVRCREGNFLALPEDLTGMADLAFAIEAFVHSPDADGFLSEAASILRPGGRLVICDDFLTAADRPFTARERRWLDEFRTGWRIGSLLTVDDVRSRAAAYGLTLVRDVDLTTYLQLRRWRDRWVSLVVASGRLVRPKGEYWHSLLGGNALQYALLRGLLHYRFLELRADG